MSGNSRESLSKVMDEVTQLKSIVFRYGVQRKKIRGINYAFKYERSVKDCK